MAPASASLLPAATSNAGTKRPFAAEASDTACAAPLARQTMAPASASLLPAPSSNAGAKRPFAADSAPDAAEQPLAQEGAVTKKSGQIQQQQKLECPRCSSSDTKFCYYNNYSTAQPRHYCRTCRRYWTHGGTLRKVPVGGACRRGGSSKRRKPSAEPHTPSSDSPPPPQPDKQDTLPPLPVFPFLTDGGPVFLPQFDLGLGGFPWTAPAATDNLYDSLAPWAGCDGALTPTGAWEDFGGLELTWPLPPPPAAGN